MSRLPQHLTNSWWGAERALPIRQALDALLDEMEHVIDDEKAAEVELPSDLLPLSTGLLALDRVLGGGIRRGRVTIVEADIAAQGAALLNTVARNVPHRCLLDGYEFYGMVTGILAGSAGVPQVNLDEVCLTEREWASVVSGLVKLRDLDVLVCSTGSISALGHVTRSTGAEVLLVHDPGRFGRPIEFVAKLAKLAATSGVAVLVSASPLGDLPEWTTDDVTRLGMHGFDFGGRASLVRPDPDDLLAVAQVDVECLCGIVR